ncbi:MAG: hypothetical protein ACOYEW_05505 [Anaerolineae bacterium]|jgi:hypothetical protein
MRSRIIAFLAALALIVAACGGSSPAATDTPAPAEPAAATATPQPAATLAEPVFVSPVSPIPFDRPGLPLNTGRSETALAWVDLAIEAAQKWSPDAQFLGIQPSYVMERNLPFMPSAAGWFYSFGRPQDVLQYYVQVVDGRVTGSVEAEAIGERPKPQPVDVNAVVLDSDDALQVYLNSLSGAAPSEANIDYSLAVDPDLGKAIWWIYNLEESDQKPVLAVDAATGQVLAME